MALLPVKREPKDLRYRREFFPNANELVFDTERKGFIPLPIMFRKLIRHLSAAELRVLIYLHLRASRYGICYPTIDEIVHELGLTSRKNLMPHLASLADNKYISIHIAGPRRYFLIHDPRIPITHLMETGALNADETFEINELFKDFRQDPVEVPRPMPKGRRASTAVENQA